MNTILLQPTDVLFFRDGRPMNGALAGHGAAWPLPNVINAAFHAALHRGFPLAPGEKVGANATRYGDHLHRIVRTTPDGRKTTTDTERHRRFGSLVTAGPFPVDAEGGWYFPRPADLLDATLTPTLLPVHISEATGANSLPNPLRLPIGSSLPPEKEYGAKSWLSREAYDAYLQQSPNFTVAGHALDDADFFDQEHTIGIGIDRESGTAADGQFYSAHYLRLRDRDDWKMGVIAECQKPEDARLFETLISPEANIVIGGQQRGCTARRTKIAQINCLPKGLTQAGQFRLSQDKALVKWILLNPAIWPEMVAGVSRRGTTRQAHCGGWLPNWIHPESGQVLLQVVAPEERKRRRSLNNAGRGYGSQENTRPISAKLVAALVPKPLVVTGWSLPDELAEKAGGAQSTELAAPAGAVYYFEAEANAELGTSAAQEAEKLAAALNWHGDDKTFTTIKNRRSTLLGEKGFGLGVCGTWELLPDVAPRPLS